MANNVFSFSSGYRPFCSSWWKHQLDWRTWYYPFKYSYQRVTRGWADRDTWSLDYHIAQVLSESIVHLKETTHGYPAGLVPEGTTEEEAVAKWNEILTTMCDGFAIVQKMDDVPEEFITESETEVGIFGGPKKIYDWPAIKKYQAEQIKTFNKGMKLFHKYFFNLWD